MNLFAITSLLCGVFCLVLAVFSSLSGKSTTHKLLALYNIVVSLWGFGCFIAGIAKSSEAALVGWKVADMGGFFIGVIFYHCIIELFSLKRPSIILYFGYLQGIIFNLLDLFTDKVKNKTNLIFGVFHAETTPLLSIATAIYLFFVILSYWELFRLFQSPESSIKFQARVIAFGFCFGFLGGTSVLFTEFNISWLYPLGNIGIFIYAAIMSYAVLRHNVFDSQALANKVHREKLKIIGTLAASVQHEIKNPLYVIQNISEMHLANLDEGNYETKEKAIEKSTEILRKSVDHSKRAMEIMRSFTQFAKKNVSEEPQLEPVQLSELLDGLMPIMNAELSMNRVNFVRNFPNELSPFQMDRRHAEEVFFNLIANSCQAFKASKKTGEIRIEAERHNGSVKVNVSDNGPGIPQNQLKQIFEPFYSTKDEGTGLGLYITKQLVERNGGNISVVSKIGEGTSFKLEFKR